MIKEQLEKIKLIPSLEGKPNKKRIENLVVLIVILIVTIILINTIWSGGSKTNEKENLDNTSKMLAIESSTEQNENLEAKMEKILSTIKDVGKVNVFINYAETSSFVPIYDEKTITSNIIEEDTSGGSRNTTETESEKQVVFSESSGSKEPIAQKTVMPVIQGAIITAEGGANATVKTNITNAVQAVTGLSIDKIQVFEMRK